MVKAQDGGNMNVDIEILKELVGGHEDSAFLEYLGYLVEVHGVVWVGGVLRTMPWSEKNGLVERVGKWLEA